MEKRYYLLFFLAVALISFANAQTNVGSSVVINISSSGTNDFTVVYDEFRNSGTTNFDSLTDQQLGQLNTIFLNNDSYGSVRFNPSGSINLTEVHENMIIDLDQHIEFGSNSFFINNSYFTNLVVPVEITLSDVSLGNPRVLRNGVICSDCQIISFSGGSLVFTTESLNSSESSLFTLENIPTSGGGGGGGGRSPDKKPGVNFTVVPEVVRLRMTSGESRTQTFTITSQVDFGFYLYNEVLIFPSWVEFSSDNFTVTPENPASVGVTFTVPEYQKPDVITDKIFFRFNRTHAEEVKVIYEIYDDNALFDLSSLLSENLLWNYQRLKPEITLVNLADSNNVDVDLEYVIKDYENNEVAKIGQEAFSVSGRENVVNPELPLISYIRSGDYVFYTKLNYQGNQAVASNEFSVRYFNIWVYLLILFLILGFVGVFLWLYDSDYRRFRKIIALGEHYLQGKDLENAKRKYKKMMHEFPYMNAEERKAARLESVGFYEKLVNEIKKPE